MVRARHHHQPWWRREEEDDMLMGDIYYRDRWFNWPPPDMYNNNINTPMFMAEQSHMLERETSQTTNMAIMVLVLVIFVLAGVLIIKYN
jgi:hypothetical protein